MNIGNIERSNSQSKAKQKAALPFEAKAAAAESVKQINQKEVVKPELTNRFPARALLN